jgi:hypothetical protein
MPVLAPLSSELRHGDGADEQPQPTPAAPNKIYTLTTTQTGPYVAPSMRATPVKDHPDLRELQQSCTFHPGCNFHPSPHAAAGGRMRRLEADGHVTRFVTRTLCHAVTLGRRAETAVSPVGWSAGMSGVRVGRCETAACRLITQRS